jgi:hypothetical protein
MKITFEVEFIRLIEDSLTLGEAVSPLTEVVLISLFILHGFGLGR